MAEKLLCDFFRGPGKFYSKLNPAKYPDFAGSQAIIYIAAPERVNSPFRIPQKPDRRAAAEERMVKLWLPS
jgi:hypothetical protein